MLQNLRLSFCKQATDPGIVPLVGLTKLRSLALGITQVTDSDVAELQQPLPRYEIEK